MKGSLAGSNKLLVVGMSVGASVPLWEEMAEPIRARSDNTLHSDAEFGSVGPSRVPNR
jgi:hypothetical protein